jgi:hypothetical protein
VERPRPPRPAPGGSEAIGAGEAFGDALQKPTRAARIAGERRRAVPGLQDLQRELGRLEGRLEITETAESTLRQDLERERERAQEEAPAHEAGTVLMA